MMAGGLADPDLAPPPPEPPAWVERQRAWVVSAHADVQAMLRLRTMVQPDPRALLGRMEARTGQSYPRLAAVLDGTMLFQTGARHANARQVMGGVLADLSRRWSVDALRVETRTILAALPCDATLDVAAGLAEELPCRVAGDMLGLAPHRLRRLRAMSQQVTQVWRPLPALREYARLEALCAEAHADLEAAPPCLHGAPAGALETPLADLVMFLMIAAVDSTASTIAAGLDLLARDPALQVRLRAEPHLLDGFVAETLRLAGPLRRLNDRIAQVPTTIGGVAIPAGAAAIPQIDRAHRDPLVYPDPHRIDLARDGPATLGFGGGAHACQGGALGQAQVTAMLAGVLERFAIAPGPGRRALAEDPILRRFAQLPVRLARLA